MKRPHRAELAPRRVVLHYFAETRARCCMHVSMFKRPRMLFAFAVSIACVAASGSVVRPPNFVVLFLDDHGWGDAGFNTNGAVTETPNMDRLASGGMRFADFHVGFSVCTASRGALLTGRTCPRTNVCGNFGPESKHGMALDELTMANLLKRASTPYDTHMIGKWHLGHNEPFSPTYRGFDTYYGLPFSGDMGCIDTTPQGCKPEWSRTKGQPACPALCVPENASNPAPTVGIPLYDSTASNCSSHASCNDDIVSQPFNPMTLNAQYAARAKRILAQYAEDDASPFLLYMAFAHTHTPLGYDEARFGNASSRPGWSQVFGNTLAEVDDAVGQVHTALETLGLAENTLIFLTADNGPADLSSVACEMVGDQGPYIGAWQRSKAGGGGGGTAKSTEWEGGHRVVGLAHWEGTIAKGQSTDALVSSLDFVPTFASLAGVELPADRVYDGIDLSPLLRGDVPATADAGHKTLFHPTGQGDYPSGVPAMRLGKYKAFFETKGSKPCRLANGTHRDDGGNAHVHDPPLIFDVQADPGESTPIDPSTIPDVLAQIKSEYAAYWKSVNSTLKSKTDYSSGGRHFSPCGNQSSPSCRTERSSAGTSSPPEFL